MASACILCSLLFSALFLREAAAAGFTVDFIHRDSPLSPLYNPLETQFDRFYNAYHRSISRVNRLRSKSSSSKALQSHIIPSGGEYFMNFSIGTPPVEVFAIADTGSDLTWVQCKPCDQCYDQKSPLFDPKQSSTYKNVPCGADSCHALDSSERSCDRKQDYCKYTYHYGDQSYTKGNVATEHLTIGSTNGSPVSLPEIIFGCGHNNGGTFDGAGSGIVGLGGGPLSFVSQISATIGGEFSYCLVPTSTSKVTSKITFGNSDGISSAGIATTPLIEKEPSTYYYVTLEAISVGDKRLPYATSSMEHGNMIVDSGTTLTLLDSELYDKLESALEEAIKAERGSDPRGFLSPCFKEAGKDGALNLPVLTFHFTSADVQLQPYNTFAKVEDDLVCFAMVPSNDIAIFGNLAQMDIMVGYDLAKRTLSFAPTDCTKH
ncbi:hypothetical protein SLA2020_457800 [Shorea laevis]